MELHIRCGPIRITERAVPSPPSIIACGVHPRGSIGHRRVDGPQRTLAGWRCAVPRTVKTPSARVVDDLHPLARHPSGSALHVSCCVWICHVQSSVRGEVRNCFRHGHPMIAILLTVREARGRWPGFSKVATGHHVGRQFTGSLQLAKSLKTNVNDANLDAIPPITHVVPGIRSMQAHALADYASFALRGPRWHDGINPQNPRLFRCCPQHRGRDVRLDIVVPCVADEYTVVLQVLTHVVSLFRLHVKRHQYWLAGLLDGAGVGAIRLRHTSETLSQLV